MQDPDTPALVLLAIAALTLWLFGVVSGLLVPLVCQKASYLWHHTLSLTAQGADYKDESALFAGNTNGLQSRPLSDVGADDDEAYDDDDDNHMQGHHSQQLALSQQHHQQHLLQAARGVTVTTTAALSPHWHITQSDFERFKSVVDPVRSRLLTGDLGPGWSCIM